MKFKKIIILPIGIFLGVLIIFKLNIFQVHKIDVKNNGVDCVSDDNLKTLIGANNKNIFLIDEKDIRRKIISNFFCVKDVKVDKKLPDTLVLTLQGRADFVKVVLYQPLLPLTLNDLENPSASSAALLDWSLPSLSGNPTFISDETGFIFKQGENNNIPVLFLSGQNLKIGQQLDSQMFGKIFLIFDKLKSLQFVADTISKDNNLSGSDGTSILPIAKIVDDYIQITYQAELVFSLKKDIFRQLASLQLILQKDKINSGTMKTIDLRFDKPVVVYTVKK
ncbi:MAG: FtsQ-type POTRA domain-containing protein [Patescibacteria group bacterium]|nr:FtsQ-type POTRA domain-containing protein [Patescibacteria group bacterium]